MNPGNKHAHAVESRAGGRCEYCRMHPSLQGATFHVEHIFPQSRGGVSDLSNLAWCCPSCNSRKSDRIDAVDPETKNLIRLYNPRTDHWDDHFRFDRYEIKGQTAVGRATLILLELNNKRRLLIRQAEECFGYFPPPSSFVK